MRNPINSILFQNKNIKFMIQKIMKTVKAMKSEVKQGNYSNTLYHIKAVSSDFKEISSSQRILDSSTNILHFFVNDLLDFAQIQSNNFKKTPEVFSVKEAIQDLIEMQTF